MKKFTLYIIILFSLFMGACSKEDLNNSNVTEENEISVIEAVSLPFDFEGVDSRTIINMGNTNIALPVWAQGDTIGIYPSAGGDQLSFPIVEGVNTNKCEFTGGGWALKASTATTTYKYTAYTPFNRSYYQLKDNTALPVSMLGQKQIGNDNSNHLGAYDLQIANGDTPTSGKISFAFKHKVAIVRMDITAPKAGTWKSIILESDAAFTTQAAMNLSLDVPTVTPTVKAKSVTLELENVKTNTDNLSIVAYMMMLPVDFTGKDLTMKLVDADDNVYSSSVTFNNPTNISNPRKFGEANPRWISAVFEEISETEEIPYVTFSAESVQTLSMSQAVETMEYSVNGGEWASLGTTTVTFGGNYGDLRLRAQNENGTNGSGIVFGNVTPVSCSGDIRTLVDYENYSTVYTGRAMFSHMFASCSNLTTAPKLPATTLAKECYNWMFAGCSNLITAPELPATTLAESCYRYMFNGCSSLTKAPVLPATTLAESCYSYMFVGCSNLTTAPELPVTNLAKSCYSYMFKGCSSLTKAPELPATTLAKSCYSYMFYGCSSLTKAPVLPATVMTDSCYEYMFYGCSSLTKAPVLPATIMTDSCYEYMFYGCTSLTEAPVLPATLLASGCYFKMFGGCSNLTTAPELPATTLAEYCYSSMFYKCTSLTEAPVLPATLLASCCYYNMFYKCTSLTEAPELPATTLAEACYREMFSGCSKLNKITMLATDISAADCLNQWLYNVSSKGTFIKAAEMNESSFTTGESGIPSGWTVVNYTGNK